MKEIPSYLKLIAILGLLSAVIGLVMAIMIPGNIASVPLVVAFAFALPAIIIAVKGKYKCYGGYITSAIAIIGFVVLFVQQSKVPEIAVDEKQEEVIEEANEEAIDMLNDDSLIDEIE